MYFFFFVWTNKIFIFLPGRFLYGWSYNPSEVLSFAKCLQMAGLNECELLDLSFTYWLSLSEIDELSTLHFFLQILVLAIFSRMYLQEFIVFLLTISFTELLLKFLFAFFFLFDPLTPLYSLIPFW